MNKFIFFPILISAVFLFPSQGMSQPSFELPRNIRLDDKEDYAKYEKTMIAAAKWLEETDFDKDEEKRKQVNAFVIQWIAGSPSVTINLDQALARLIDRNPELLALYLASYSRNMLENKKTYNSFDATKAALLSIVKVYKKGINVSRSKEIEKLSKTIDQGQLDDYLINTLKMRRA